MHAMRIDPCSACHHDVDHSKYDSFDVTDDMVAKFAEALPKLAATLQYAVVHCKIHMQTIVTGGPATSTWPVQTHARRSRLDPPTPTLPHHPPKRQRSQPQPPPPLPARRYCCCTHNAAAPQPMSQQGQVVAQLNWDDEADTMVRA